jgi:hypothetical protein
MMQQEQSPRELLEALKEVIDCLEAYDLDERREYTRKLASRLRPLVDRLDEANRTGLPRDRMGQLMVPINEIMHEVNGAATKGEMEIFSEQHGGSGRQNPLNVYWDLYTIFRESSPKR